MITKKQLREMKQETENLLTKAVITDLLSQGTTEEINFHMIHVLQYGCVSGTVTSLIYYDDTDKFYKKFYNEIFEMLSEYKENYGDYPNIDLNANNLAWYGYEETVRNIMNEFGEEY